MEKAFYFIWQFGHVGKRLVKKVKVNLRFMKSQARQ